MRRFLLLALALIFLPTAAFALQSLSNTSATTATISAPATGTVTYHACQVTVSIVGGSGGATGTVVANLRDSTTGAGNVLWTIDLGTPASTTAGITLFGDWAGKPGNAMTLEFAGSGTNSANETVTLQYVQDGPCIVPPS